MYRKLQHVSRLLKPEKISAKLKVDLFTRAKIQTITTVELSLQQIATNIFNINSCLLDLLKKLTTRLI